MIAPKILKPIAQPQSLLRQSSENGYLPGMEPEKKPRDLSKVIRQSVDRLSKHSYMRRVETSSNNVDASNLRISISVTTPMQIDTEEKKMRRSRVTNSTRLNSLNSEKQLYSSQSPSQVSPFNSQIRDPSCGGFSVRSNNSRDSQQKPIKLPSLKHSPSTNLPI